MSSAGIDPEPDFTGNEFGTDSTSKAAKQVVANERLHCCFNKRGLRSYRMSYNH